MSLQFDQSAQAIEDMRLIAAYFGRESTAVADRFLASCKNAFTLIHSQPELGAMTSYRRRELKMVRRCVVTGFEKYWIYYSLSDEAITILKVRHSSRKSISS